jgi:hypothetical protein
LTYWLSIKNKTKSFFKIFIYHITRSSSFNWSNWHESTTSRPCFSIIVLVSITLDASIHLKTINNSTKIRYIRMYRYIFNKKQSFTNDCHCKKWNVQSNEYVNLYTSVVMKFYYVTSS